MFEWRIRDERVIAALHRNGYACQFAQLLTDDPSILDMAPCACAKILAQLNAQAAVYLMGGTSWLDAQKQQAKKAEASHA